MNTIKKFISNYYKLIGLIIGITIIFVDLLICNVTVTYGDANGYCLMAEWFRTEGLFNFNVQPPVGSTEAYLFSLRGYAWPLIIAVCKTLGFGTQAGFWFFYAGFLALGLSYALPEFVEVLFEKKINWDIRILPVVLTICFWNGLIKYPLSDIPSVVTVSFGLMFLAKISEKKKYFINIIYAILCGLMLGISYYIRSGCKPIIIFVVIILLVYKFKRLYVKKIGAILAVGIGIGVTMLPQIMINSSCSNVISYEVPIFFNSSVAQMSYYQGFKWLRYETNISGIHPETTMISYDDVLDTILAAENIAVEDVGLTTILKLFIKYPLEFLGMYSTKFANCLDPRYGDNLYIMDLDSRQYGVMISNYLLWFLAFWGISLQMNTEKIDKKMSQVSNVGFFIRRYALYIGAFIVPSIIHLAGTHIEARYFYPCYVLMYIFLGALCPWRKMFDEFKKKWITVGIICIALFGCLNAIWNFTFENFNYSQLLTDNDYVIKQGGKETIILEDSNTQSINYDIWSFEMKDETYLSMTGYILALDKKAEDSELSLVLSSENTSYIFDINLTENVYAEDEYKYSKYSINKELVGLGSGQYEIGFILKNGSDKSVIFTERYININKE